MGLYVQESFVNATEGYRYGDSDVYESFTDSLGKLYKSCQREYGRCTGKVYVDSDDGTKAIGWVFVGRAKYDDCNETYLRETWVTVHDCPPTKTTEYHYHEIRA